MARVTSGRAGPSVIGCSQPAVNLALMLNNSPNPTLFEDAVNPVDADRVLESIVSELEVLTSDSPMAARSDLIALHGALLAYELGGVAASLPSPGFGMSGRRLLERRVAKAARQLIGTNEPDLALRLACTTIEDLIHLIDPELRFQAA